MLPGISRRSPALALIAVLAACGPTPGRDVRVTPSVSQTGVASQPPLPLASDDGSTIADVSVDLDRKTAAILRRAFREDVTVPVPTDTDALADLAHAPSWDIDVRSYETFDRVRYYVARFTGDARGRFTERLSVGTRYEPMIRAKLRNGNLPEDMYYLALVESGFNPHAYSRAAAVGMWQFMSSTARGMGLRVDWWVDERRDPVRSTDAAVRFLAGLNEQFGSLYLAAAAYNGGPGRIARGLSRYADDLEGSSGDDQFFALAEKKYLRNETREYVPQLIAAALVAKEPDRYGLDIPALEPFAYDSVMVGPSVALAAIAAASGSTVPVIQDLNPHILRGMTPPKGTIKVRVPLGSAAAFDSALAAQPVEMVAGAQTIVTEKGATWASIAKKAKVPARSIALYNPKVKPSKSTGRIAPGTAVLVPSAATVAAAFPVPDPSIELYGTGTRTHVVRSGENLSVIAKRYRTTAAAIMRLNGLKKPLIFPGQELLVRGTPAPSKAPTKKATAPKR